jgi:hypothetical protein
MMKDFVGMSVIDRLVSFEKKRKLQEVLSGIWVLLTGKDSCKRGRLLGSLKLLKGMGTLSYAFISLMSFPLLV